MSKPKKIAYIIDTIGAPTGGTEKQLLYLLNGLDRNVIDPHLFCFYPSEWMKSQNFSFPVTYLNVSRILGPDLYFGSRQLKAVHAREHFDIAQTFFKDGNIFGTYAAHKAKIPHIISSRRNVGYWHDGLQIRILRFLEQWTTHYLANSQAAIDMTMKIEQAKKFKFQLIYNGLDLAKFSEINDSMRTEQRKKWNIADSDIVIGIVANLRPVKRHDNVINDAKTLIGQNNKLKFVFIGEGPDRPKLEAHIAELGLSEHFRLPGATTDIVPALSGFDIAVLPSSNESFSNSLIEYMAAKLPVIATRVGGNIEAIEHGENGLLYDIDDANGLINAVKEILEHDDKANKMAENAQIKAFEEYSIEKMIANHQIFYLNL